MGIATPKGAGAQVQNPDWSVIAVKGDSPSETTKRESRMSMLAPLQISPFTRKRSHDHAEMLANKENRDSSPTRKKQTTEQASLATSSKRPPFPISVTKPRSRSQQTTGQQNSSNGTISKLNPFATVFRPPLSAPKLGSAPKEFSPLNLQQSSKSLFNVFAPEFNPSVSRPAGLGTGSMNPPQLFAQPSIPSIFVKPSPRKKAIPIVPPPTNGKQPKDASDDSAKDMPDQEKPIPQAPYVTVEDGDTTEGESLSKDGESDRDRLSSQLDGEPSRDGCSSQLNSDQEEFEYEIAAMKRAFIQDMFGTSDDEAELKALENSSEDGDSDALPTTKATTSKPFKRESGSESESPYGAEANFDQPRRIARMRPPGEIKTEKDLEARKKLDARSAERMAECEKADPGLSQLICEKTPVSNASSEPGLKQSPEEEFHGYPAFWEQRLSQSEEKARRDRPLIPHGRIARNLTKEFEHDNDSEATESEHVSDKENRIMADMEDYSGEESDESVLKMKSRLFERRRYSSSRMETVVRERLLPVMKVLEAVHADVQKLHAREQMKEEEASDADDEDDEIDIKKPSHLSHDRIKSAVIEAFKQEKDLFTALPTVPDRSAEVKDLKAIVDGLKSKLLDSESNLDREERQRKELERQNELLSRDFAECEQNMESKSAHVKEMERELKELRNRIDETKCDLNNERHNSAKLNEIILGIRDSLGQMTDKNAKLATDLSLLQSLTTSQRDDISSLREEISKARGQTGKVTRERNMLERELEEERNRFINLQNELMETGRAVAEQETRWREELTAEKLRVQSLERNLADEERRVKKMDEECEKLSLMAEERGKLKAMVEAAVGRERSLESIKEKLESRVHLAEARAIVVLEEQSRREQAFEIRLEKEKEELKGEVQLLRETVKALQEERMRTNRLLEQERTSLAVRAEKIKTLERDLKQAANTHTERQALLESTTSDLRESQSTVRDLQKDITSLRIKLDRRDEQLEAVRTCLDTQRAEIVEKDKHIVDLEFIVASTPSPTKKSRDEELYIKLQRREKEILRIRELMASLLQDHEDLIAQSRETLVPEQQKQYNAMKNVLRAERERRKNVERELLRMQAKAAVRGGERGVTPRGSRSVSFFETPASGVRGLDTPVSLNHTPGSMTGIEDTPLKGKGVFVE